MTKNLEAARKWNDDIISISMMTAITWVRSIEKIGVGTIA